MNIPSTLQSPVCFPHSKPAAASSSGIRRGDTYQEQSPGAGASPAVLVIILDSQEIGDLLRHRRSKWSCSYWRPWRLCICFVPYTAEIAPEESVCVCPLYSVYDYFVEEFCVEKDDNLLSLCAVTSPSGIIQCLLIANDVHLVGCRIGNA